MNKVLSLTEIKQKLPYTYPMLLVDRAVIENENRCVGVKNLTFNEEFFQGHFPGHPIMPGVLQVETMKQVAKILVGEKINPNKDKNVYIKNLKRVKFRKPSLPGDRLSIEIDVLNITDNEAEIKAVIKNNAGVGCQANITLATRYKQEPTTMPSLYNEYDKTGDIVMNIEQLQNVIPHRYPFLLLDYIVSMDEQNVLAVKNLSYNEPVFRGHAPEFPFLPEGFQMEIVAQASCAQMLSQPENKGLIGYFMGVDRAEFLKPIFPGDQLIVSVEKGETKGRFGKATGKIQVEGEDVATMKLSFALVDA